MSELHEGVHGATGSDTEAKASDNDGLTRGIPGRKPSRDDLSWCNFARQETQRAVDVCRQSGKVILQVMSFLVPGYMTGLYAIFKDVETGIPCGLMLPLWFWIAALTLALIALLPWPWTTAPDCPDEIKGTFASMARWKWRFVFLSGILVIGGMVALLVVQPLR